MKYQVWHAKEPTFGMTRKEWPDDYEHVANVEADDLDDAFTMTNNGVPGRPDRCWDNDEVELVGGDRQGIRSLSVGDVLAIEGGKAWECRPTGWSQIF